MPKALIPIVDKTKLNEKHKKSKSITNIYASKHRNKFRSSNSIVAGVCSKQFRLPSLQTNNANTLIENTLETYEKPKVAIKTVSTNIKTQFKSKKKKKNAT